MTLGTYYFTVFAFFAFALGACLASFLNVCIWRLPREESVVSPPSHCPKCGAAIRWYQNVPIVSWLALRGKCAACGAPISPRYILVETLGGVLFLLTYCQWACPVLLACPPPLGLGAVCMVSTVPVAWLVILGLILGSFIDLDHYYLPDRVTIGGMILGPVASYLVPELHVFDVGMANGRGVTALASLAWSGAGLAFGFLFLWGIGAVFSKLFKKEAMGFGDVKLMGAIGAFFGPFAVLFVLIASSVVGSVAGLALLARGRARLGGFTAIPYGPYLALATLVWMFWGPRLFALYLNVLGPR